MTLAVETKVALGDTIDKFLCCGQRLGQVVRVSKKQNETKQNKCV